MKDAARSVPEILTGAFNRKQIYRPGYSLTALARDLGVSAAFITNIMCGKRKLPKTRLESLSQILELDIPEKSELFSAVLLGNYRSSFSSSASEGIPSRERTSIATKSERFLSKWWNVVVLECLTLEPPFNEARQIQSRLGISQAQFEETIDVLLEAGLITENRGVFSKKANHLYLPVGRSKKEIRSFHEQMIAKAQSQLLHRITDDDYKRRLINGFTIAIDPDKIELLKKKILEFADEFSIAAASEKCSDVYQLNVQFFPLLKKRLRSTEPPKKD